MSLLRPLLTQLLLLSLVGTIFTSATAQIQVPTAKLTSSTPRLPDCPPGGLIVDCRQIRHCFSIADLGRVREEDPLQLALGCFADPPVVMMLRAGGFGTVVEGEIATNTCFGGEFPISSFGAALANAGDIDGDGLADLAVGAQDLSLELGDVISCGATSRRIGEGAVFLLFMQDNLTYREDWSLLGGTDNEGNMTAVIPDSGWFGDAISGLGDIDNDGVPDLLVGAPGRDIPRALTGNAYVLRMQTDGTVKEMIPEGLVSAAGGFTQDLPGGARFGDAVAAIGDLDGDGIPEIAVGAPGMGEAGTVFVIFLQSDGSAKPNKWLQIAEGQGGFTDDLRAGDAFGTAVAAGGDIDDDGVPDLLVGAPGYNEGGVDRGAVWRLFMNRDGTVRDHQRIGAMSDGMYGLLADGDQFGAGITVLDDMDRDGRPDLAVTAENGRATWIIFGLPPPLDYAANVSTTPTVPSVEEEISVTGDWGSGLLGARLNCRSPGQQFLGRAMLFNVGSRLHEGVIPTYCVGETGSEYFVELETEEGSTRYPPVNAVSIPVKSDGLEIPVLSGVDQSEYRLISFPLAMDSVDALTALEPSLGDYDVETWRFFGESPTDGRLIELGEGPLALRPGAGYWFLSRNSTVILTGPGTSVQTTPGLEIPLRPGWNYIGNPYRFVIPVSNLSRRHAGESVDILSYEEGWTRPDSLGVFRGYVVFNELDVNDTLVVDGYLSDKSDKSGKPSAGPVPDWSLQIKARRGSRLDDLNEAIVIKGASNDVDAFDKPEPPVIGDYVQIFFRDIRWGENAEGARVDARPNAADGHKWTLVVASATSGLADLEFLGLDAIPGRFDVALVDKVLGLSRNLRDLSQYRLLVPAAPGERELQLLVGPTDQLEQVVNGLVPNPTTLGERLEVFPTPTSGPVSIRYTVANETIVSVHVFDILGRRVATIVDRGVSQIGWNDVFWDGITDSGSRVAPGQYFVRLTTAHGATTRQVVVARRPNSYDEPR